MWPQFYLSEREFRDVVSRLSRIEGMISRIDINKIEAALMALSNEDVVARLSRIEVGLSTVRATLAGVLKNQEIEMATVQELLAAVQSEKTVDDLIIALVQQLKASVDAAVANAGLSAEEKAAVDAAFELATSNAAAVGDAVVANTPAAPPA